MARNRYYEDEKQTYKFNKSSLKKAIKYAIPYKKTLIVVGVLMVIFSFVSLLPTLINTYIIDYVLSKTGIYGIDYLTLAVILVAGYALAVISTAVFNYFRTLYMSKVGYSMVHDMRYVTFERLQKLAFDYYDSRPAGKILVRVTNYLDELADVLSHSVMLLLVDTLKIIVIIAMLFVIDYRLAAIISVTIIPLFIVLMLLRKVLTKRRREFRDKRSNRTAYVAESIQGNNVTKVFNNIEKSRKAHTALNTEALGKWRRFINVNELFFPLMDIFFYAGLCVVYVIVVFTTLNGNGFDGLTIGKLIGFISYMSIISGPLNEIAAVLQQVSMATANLESVFEVMETEPTVKDDENATELPQIEGDVSFKNVYFEYEENHPILANVSFDVPKGKMIALVGPTGSGKTTIVSLLSRFYNLSSGTITIDGTDISKVTLHSLRKQVGVMMQDSFIFSGTIIENIRYARPDATDEECIEAAKTVCAHNFISRLPDGYYTETIEQGKRLSKGERQLISFARVMLTDPKILILDEATSSIDTRTEDMIRQALDVVLEGRTSFVIAHRLSTVRKADCIFYIADKGIAEAGTHEQLMKKKGKYYELVNAHSKDDELD